MSDGDVFAAYYGAFRCFYWVWIGVYGVGWCVCGVSTNNVVDLEVRGKMEAVVEVHEGLVDLHLLDRVFVQN